MTGRRWGAYGVRAFTGVILVRETKRTLKLHWKFFHSQRRFPADPCVRGISNKYQLIAHERGIDFMMLALSNSPATNATCAPPRAIAHPAHHCMLCLAALAVIVIIGTIRPEQLQSRFGRAAWGEIGDNVFGLCPAQPSVFSEPLRWSSDPEVADRICCKNHDYAEYSGYWLSLRDFPFGTLPEGVDSITFFDVSSGVPLFRAPIGRSWAAFIAESRTHGWPSFRDAEVIWSNVRVLPGGETVSVNGTHLGHNLPDGTGNRYCINIVCGAGHGPGGA